jgi:hypothetical protein
MALPVQAPAAVQKRMSRTERNVRKVASIALMIVSAVLFVMAIQQSQHQLNTYEVPNGPLVGVSQ